MTSVLDTQKRLHKLEDSRRSLEARLAMIRERIEEAKSACCFAPMKVSTGDEGTSFWLCGNCGKACNPQPVSKEELEKQNVQLLADRKQEENTLNHIQRKKHDAYIPTDENWRRDPLGIPEDQEERSSSNLKYLEKMQLLVSMTSVPANTLMTPADLFDALWHRDLVKLSDGLEPKEAAKALAKASFLMGASIYSSPRNNE